jgi:hypothetical protein
MDPLDALLNRASQTVGEITFHSLEGKITPQHENEVDYASRVAHKTISWQSPRDPEKTLFIHIHIWQAGFFRKRIKTGIEVLVSYSNGAINANIFSDLTLNRSPSEMDMLQFEQTVREAAEWALRNT